jgi:hypothetical protein
MELKIAQQHEYDMLEELISHAYLRTLQDELDDQLFGLQSLAIAWDGKQPKGYGFIYWPGPRELGVADLFPGCPEIFRMTVMQIPIRGHRFENCLLPRRSGKIQRLRFHRTRGCR